MSKVDEHLSERFRDAQRAVRIFHVHDQLDRRRARRQRLRQVESVALAATVLAATIGGTLLLEHVFREEPPRPGGSPVRNGLLVASLDDRWGAHLYVVDPQHPANPHERPLTTTSGVPEQDTDPAVSPDGRTVAFAHRNLSTLAQTIWVIGIDGTGLRRLTEPAGIAMDPAWSPDGTQLAFAGSLGGPYGIWVMNADGADGRLIPGTDEIAVGHPTWSPDGSMLAFQGSGGDNDNQPVAWDIYAVPLDSDSVSALVDLTNTPDESEVMPSWSPDGASIVFANGARDLGIDDIPFGGIGVMDADGTDRRELTDPGTFDQHPSWSPDGTLIAFERMAQDFQRDNPEMSDIFVMRADGTDVHRVSIGSEPAWQALVGEIDESPSPSIQSVVEVQVEPGAGQMVVAYGSVWVSQPNSVIRVDVATGRILAEIPVSHMDEADIAAGGGYVWVTTRNDVVGIDVASNQIDHRMSILTGIRTIAYADGHLYVGHAAEGNGQLIETNPTIDEFQRSVLTGGVGLGESAIVPTSDAFWIGYSSPDSQGVGSAGLVRVPSDLSRADVVTGVERAFSVAEAGGFIWAVGTGVLYQVTPDGTLVGTFEYPLVGKIASDGTRLWLLMNTGSTSEDIYLPDPNVPTRIVEVDTQTGALIGEGTALPHNVPANIAAADGEVWVSFYDDGILTRLTFEILV